LYYWLEVKNFVAANDVHLLIAFLGKYLIAFSITLDEIHIIFDNSHISLGLEAISQSRIVGCNKPNIANHPASILPINHLGNNGLSA